MKLIPIISGLLLLITSCQNGVQKELPNVVVIYVDDLGYGDVGCYGAKGVETPNIDLLATQGVKFTDAHSSAATCTPSRFSLLTGQYAFRSKANILAGDASLIIKPGAETLPSLFKRAGYRTGVVGKWHLGLGDGNIDWNDSIKPGPREIGFDYSFLIPATGDRVPSVYVENYHVLNLDKEDPLSVSYEEAIGSLPTGLSHPELLKQPADTQHSNTITNGISRIGYMSGATSAIWKDEDFPFVLTSKAKEFIQGSKKPFFLYFAYHDIHVPRIPNEKFVGTSEMGPRGDVIAQMDWCTGEIIKLLKELKIDKNTWIIFSSDNGPVLNDGYEDQSVEMLGEHKPAGPFRGGKYSAFEAGTRVPTISYWPGVVKPDESDALMSQVDLMASIAALLNIEVSDSDSENHIDAWLGKSNQGRTVLLEESDVLSLRKGQWKYIPASERKLDWIIEKKGIESGISKEDKLFNLTSDPGEEHNLAEENPEKLEELKQSLQEIIEKDL